MTRITAIILLAFNGIGALYGGGMLIYDPSGELLGLPLEILKHAPFSDFLLPGLILFIIIGLGSIVSCIVTIMKKRNYPFLIIFSGIALTIWIGIQMLMLQGVHWAHILYGLIGVVLIFLGVILRKKEYRVN